MIWAHMRAIGSMVLICYVRADASNINSVAKIFPRKRKWIFFSRKVNHQISIKYRSFSVTDKPEGRYIYKQAATNSSKSLVKPSDMTNNVGFR